MEKICAYDKDRVCDETCGAFKKDTPGLDSVPYFDESDAVPQFKWKTTILLKGSRCSRLKSMIESEEVEKVE